jgi:hypothetical protein
MLDGLAPMGLGVSLGASASVARSLIRHCTERRRLELVDRLAAKHGVDAVSTLSQLIPPNRPPIRVTRVPHAPHPRNDAPARSARGIILQWRCSLLT